MGDTPVVKNTPELLRKIYGIKDSSNKLEEVLVISADVTGMILSIIGIKKGYKTLKNSISKANWTKIETQNINKKGDQGEALIEAIDNKKGNYDLKNASNGLDKVNIDLKNKMVEIKEIKTTTKEIESAVLKKLLNKNQTKRGKEYMEYYQNRIKNIKNSKTDIKLRMNEFNKITKGFNFKYKFIVLKINEKTGKVMEIREYNWKRVEKININEYKSIYKNNTIFDYGKSSTIPDNYDIYLDSYIKKEEKNDKNK